MRFIFHCVDIYTDDAKATVGKTASASAQIEASAGECAGCRCAAPQTKPVALTSVLH